MFSLCCFVYNGGIWLPNFINVLHLLSSIFLMSLLGIVSDIIVTNLDFGSLLYWYGSVM